MHSLMQVEYNMVKAIQKDSFVTLECKLLRPEALFSGTQEQEAEKVIADMIEFFTILLRWCFEKLLSI